MNNSILLVSLFFACIGGIIIIAYESMANKSGWPVGRLFRQPWFLLIFGGLSIIGSVWAAFSFFAWMGLLILPISWVIAALLTFALKKNIQFVSLFLLVSSWVLQFFVKN